MNDLHQYSKKSKGRQRWPKTANKCLYLLTSSGLLLLSPAHSQPITAEQSQSGAAPQMIESTDTTSANELDPSQKPDTLKTAEDLPASSSASGPQVEKTSEKQTQTAPKSVPVPVVAGPEKPIGHSLKTPEAQKRIEMMMANAQNSGKVGPLVAAPAPLKSTQQLVGGRYGFSANGQFTGVPKALVSLGNSSPAFGLVVEKLHHRMTLFRISENGQYEMVKSYRAITGRDPGDKVSRGDLRTPEGIYFVTGKLDDHTLPAKYGRLAYTLDYPNIYDKRQSKSGYGIWIHATDDASRLQKPFDTEGCVVVSNEDILDLQQYITPFEIPVVITKEMTSVKEDELAPTRKKALEMVDAWRKAWESSSFESYMSYYSKNFRSLGKNKNQWQSFKAKLGDERGSDIRVSISEPKIVAFEDQLLVVFLQDYQSKQHADFGRKFLYLQWEGDRYRIIAEKWYRAPRTETALRAFKAPSKQL